MERYATDGPGNPHQPNLPVESAKDEIDLGLLEAALLANEGADAEEVRNIVEDPKAALLKAEFTSGNRSKDAFDNVELVPAPKLQKVLLYDDIKPEITHDDEGNLLTKKERDGLSFQRSSKFRRRIVEALTNPDTDIPQTVTAQERETLEAVFQEGFDESLIESLRLASSEAITNIWREYPLTGGDFWLGIHIDEEGEPYLVIVTEGIPLPEGISTNVESSSLYKDPAESGRGIKVMKGVGVYHKFPIAVTKINERENVVGAWQVSCMVPLHPHDSGPNPNQELAA